ncbi:hypothetical protein [Deinococcus aquatilis]|uniref:hypothetical protein n=1 Tax=Deinococcus aquatilis TaxID=519440 RepID=UPI000377E8D0|nr:hypothetical protein [Deinococcus aquatilis]
MNFESAWILLWVLIVAGCFIWQAFRRRMPGHQEKRSDRLSVWDWLTLLLAGFGSEPGLSSSETERAAKQRKSQRR